MNDEDRLMQFYRDRVVQFRYPMALVDSVAPCHTIQISHRYTLGESLTYERVQQLLSDFYAATHQGPEHLFVSEQDHEALSEEMYKQRMSGPFDYRWSFFESEFGLGETAGRYSYRGLRRIYSHTTGNTVRIVPMPDLEQGSVIVGFFR